MIACGTGATCSWPARDTRTVNLHLLRYPPPPPALLTVPAEGYVGIPKWHSSACPPQTEHQCARSGESTVGQATDVVKLLAHRCGAATQHATS